LLLTNVVVGGVRHGPARISVDRRGAVAVAHILAVAVLAGTARTAVVVGLAVVATTAPPRATVAAPAECVGGRAGCRPLRCLRWAN
jgi:hypothetical protein